jgi:hypothetical protein
MNGIERRKKRGSDALQRLTLDELSIHKLRKKGSVERWQLRPIALISETTRVETDEEGVESDRALRSLATLAADR